MSQSLRPLPAEYLARKAVAYSPFRSGNRNTETITPAMVEEDLRLLVQGDFRLIRLFDSSDQVARLVLDVIRDKGLDMRVQLGAYVNSFSLSANPYTIADIRANNWRELDRAIALATDPRYRDIILTVSVGNETMVNWSIVPIEPQVMSTYIRHVRERVTQPVTTNDNFLFYTNPIPTVIAHHIDFAAIHLYPNIDTQYPESDLYWDWKQLEVPAGPARAKAMMDAAIGEARRQYGLVRTSLDSMGLFKMPIVVGEIGWNAVDKGKQRFRAHPVNQKLFFERLEDWRATGRTGQGPANIIYFEAFDEPWKQGDDGWGLFTVDRKARYVIQALYPPERWDSANLSDADATYFAPPAINPPAAGSQFALFTDAPGAPPLASGLRVDAFDGDSVVAPAVNSALAPEGSQVIQLEPTPKPYGWGLLWSPEAAGTTQNLSEYEPAGAVQFWVNTLYPGTIEVGISTLTAEGDSKEVFLPLSPGDHGYCNDGRWCRVSIPLTAFKARAPMLDLRLVVSPFIISDRYAFTGKASGANIRVPLLLDGIAWVK